MKMYMGHFLCNNCGMACTTKLNKPYPPENERYCDCCKEKTLCIIREFKECGDLIALFPMEPWSMDINTCSSYQHIGQHGSASLDIIRNTRPVDYKSEPVKELIKELEEHCGYNLKLGKRVPINAYGVRKAIIQKRKGDLK
jgi:hypothetical protein